MCALAQHTTHLGLVCTGTTTYDQPYLLARRFASLDLTSGGRAGWNLVTSGNRAEADSFGLPRHMDKIDRYRKGREFAHAVRGLWNSYGDGAFLRDVASGRYHDPAKLHVLDYQGAFFKVKGPLNVPPSPQGEPVMVQAGASEDGKELAAEMAEVVFGVQATIEGAKAFYADVKGRMAAWGRDPDSLKIMPGLFPCIGETHAEAEAKFEALQDLIVPEVGLQLLSNRLGYDLSGHDIMAPLPEIPRDALSSSRVELFVEMARREGLTIRDLYRKIAGARGHYQLDRHARRDRRLHGGMGGRARLRRVQHHAARLPGEPRRVQPAGDPRAAAPRRLPHALPGHHLARQSGPHPPGLPAGAEARARPQPGCGVGVRAIIQFVIPGAVQHGVMRRRPGTHVRSSAVRRDGPRRGTSRRPG